MTRKKNILFYIPTLSQDFGGIRQYSAGLLKLFSEITGIFNFFILHDGNDEVIMNLIIINPDLKQIKFSDYPLTKKERLRDKINYVYNRTKNLITKVPYNKESTLDRIIRINSIDILHCPYQYLPKVKNVKLLTTMHDVQELYFPDFFSAEERAYRAVNYLNFIKKADKVLVSYDHVKKDIEKFFKKNPSDIITLLLKMDNLWYKKYEGHKIKNLNIKFDEFLLYPANFWKHKNHENLVKAIHYLKQKKNLSVNFIFTGDYTIDSENKISKLINDFDLSSQIQTLGIVDEETLYSLYKSTLGVVIPTIYEAGSFPLMESILIGVPVICSNVTSLPETIGDEDFTFNPKSIEDIAIKIEQLWKDLDFRKKSLHNSSLQSQRLIETGAKEILIDLYSNLN